MSAIDVLMERSKQHAVEFSKGKLPAPPAKHVAVVTCMDARVEPGALLGLEAGDAHVIRNAGGIVTEDVIRSLAISQQLLGTREIMLIQHTDCGMLRLTDDALRDEIHQGTGARPTFAMGAFSDLEANVRQSIASLRTSPFLARKEAIRGFIYEVETGRLREVEENPPR